MILPPFIRGEDQSWTFAARAENGTFLAHNEATVTAKFGKLGASSVNLSVVEGTNDFEGIAEDVPCWFLLLTDTQSQALSPGIYKVQVTVVVSGVTRRYQYDVKVEETL